MNSREQPDVPGLCPVWCVADSNGPNVHVVPVTSGFTTKLVLLVHLQELFTCMTVLYLNILHICVKISQLF